jgi:hypothetical protein
LRPRPGTPEPADEHIAWAPRRSLQRPCPDRLTQLRRILRRDGR